MKTFPSRVSYVRSAILVLFCSGWWGMDAHGQANSWTNSAGGNWEDSHWSLGILPGTNQAILFTNANSKNLIIGPYAVQYSPQALTVNTVIVSSPANSSNALVLNDAGLQQPLKANYFTVGSNATVAVSGSALHIAYQLSVGGTFTQDTSSEVTNGFMNVGDVGPAIYHLNSGTLVSGDENIGPAFPSLFVQQGGTNRGSVRIRSNSEFDLNGGELEGSLWVQNGATFKQQGGLSNPRFTAVDGYFFQSGGTIKAPTNQGMYLPGYTLMPWSSIGSGVALQNGGTNEQSRLTLGLASIAAENFIGHPPDIGGSYTLSNGVLMTSGALIVGNSRMEQAGGIHVIDGDLSLHGWLYYSDRGSVNLWRGAHYGLAGGVLSVHGLHLGVQASMTQSGGTNQISGNLRLTGATLVPLGYTYGGYCGGYALNDGLLTASNISASGSPGFSQNGGRMITAEVHLNGATFRQADGTNQITGDLTISTLRFQSIPNRTYPYPRDIYKNGSYQMLNGQLTVSNVAVLKSANFSQEGGQLLAGNIQLIDSDFNQTGGNLTQSGVLTLMGHPILQVASGHQQFGALQLSVAASNAHPYLQMPPGPCLLRFTDSSSLAWSNNAVLSIGNWLGSPYGGGQHRILFGRDTNGLTAQQRSQIVFPNPAGLPDGVYSARILITGEIVPDFGGPLPLAVSLSNSAGGPMQITVGGEIGRAYAIEVSTNLLHWDWWTNQINAYGTLSVVDDDATNYPVRFYRAVLLP